MRKSLSDIACMVRDIPYPYPLPSAIQHLHCYLLDSGHCILAVPEEFLGKADKDYSDYEIGLPVKYVLDKGWKYIAGTDSISVSVKYDSVYGAIVPEEYSEF